MLLPTAIEVVSNTHTGYQFIVLSVCRFVTFFKREFDFSYFTDLTGLMS